MKNKLSTFDDPAGLGCLWFHRNLGVVAQSRIPLVQLIDFVRPVHTKGCKETVIMW